MNKCPNCGWEQWSVMDQNYQKLFGTCWHEDKMRWINKEMTEAEFEQRELRAMQYEAH